MSKNNFLFSFISLRLNFINKKVDTLVSAFLFTHPKGKRR
nr:MAG TPA_asm: hypothetical protein [Caudoviricetes sp.]